MPAALRIVIPGGTGRIGTLLASHFHEKGHHVSTITRFPKAQEWPAIHWDAENMGHWASSLDGADAVINLAGRSMNCRYTAFNHQSVLQSRLRTTRLVGEAIRQCSQPPRVWLNLSSAGIYRHSLDMDMDESAGELGAHQTGAPKRWNITPEIAQQWEAAAMASPTPGTRRVLLRVSSIMSPDAGGAFDHLLRLVRWGFGGEMGGGEQFVSWIHHFDFTRALDFLIAREDIEGPVNITAPHPSPNHQFMCCLRRSWCTSYFGLPAPTAIIEAASYLLRMESEQLLKSRRVVPRTLLEHHFNFDFPEWRGASENLVERWRNRQ